MKILCVCYHRRLWFNIVPAMAKLQQRGHQVIALYYYWPFPDNLGFETTLREAGFTTRVKEWRGDPADGRLFLAEMLWYEHFDAALLGDEGQAPAGYVWGLACAMRSGPPSTRHRTTVYAMQHGYVQAWNRLRDDLASDYFLCWGQAGIDAVKGDARFLLTGNPRFDSHKPEFAEDKGYSLLVAWPNQITPDWLARHAAGPGPYIVKQHPDDNKNYSALERPGLKILSGQQDTQELIRCAHEVITGPSTCWMEAMLYGKRVVPADWPTGRALPSKELLDRNLMAGNAAKRVADLIEQGVADAAHVAGR